MALMYNHSNRSRSIYLDAFKLEFFSRLRRTCKTSLISFVALTSTRWRSFQGMFLLLTASGVTSIYHRYIKTRVIECNVVSKLQRNRWNTFGDLRSWTNEHLHFYLYILCVPTDDGQWRPKHIAVGVYNTINALNSCEGRFVLIPW
jgi:hypothetical protein